MRLKKRKGFTLVEMVLVITILGILSSVAFMKFGDVQEKSKKNADYISAANLGTALNLAISDGTIKIEDVEKSGCLSKLINIGYIALVPKPQSGGLEFKPYKDSKNNIFIKVGEEVFYPKGYVEPNKPSDNTSNPNTVE